MWETFSHLTEIVHIQSDDEKDTDSVHGAFEADITHEELKKMFNTVFKVLYQRYSQRVQNSGSEKAIKTDHEKCR